MNNTDAPVQEGDEVVLRHEPDARGTVLEVRLSEGKWHAMVDWPDLPGQGDVYPVELLMRHREGVTVSD